MKKESTFYCVDCKKTFPVAELGSITTGYARKRNNHKLCYDCALKADIKHLKKTGKLTAYVSSDGKQVITWPGKVIARITGSHMVDFGYCRDQLSFDAVMDDGAKLIGRGPGPGMYCRVRVVKGVK